MAFWAIGRLSPRRAEVWNRIAYTNLNGIMVETRRLPHLESGAAGFCRALIPSTSSCLSSCSRWVSRYAT
jgi:hypothetical protein